MIHKRRERRASRGWGAREPAIAVRRARRLDRGLCDAVAGCAVAGLAADDVEAFAVFR
jgi:1,6-anhydro-N-acetylmuramate kinase